MAKPNKASTLAPSIGLSIAAALALSDEEFVHEYAERCRIRTTCFQDQAKLIYSREQNGLPAGVTVYQLLRAQGVPDGSISNAKNAARVITALVHTGLMTEGQLDKVMTHRVCGFVNKAITNGKTAEEIADILLGSNAKEEIECLALTGSTMAETAAKEAAAKEAAAQAAAAKEAAAKDAAAQAAAAMAAAESVKAEAAKAKAEADKATAAAAAAETTATTAKAETAKAKADAAAAKAEADKAKADAAAAKQQADAAAAKAKADAEAEAAKAKAEADKATAAAETTATTAKAETAKAKADAAAAKAEADKAKADAAAAKAEADKAKTEAAAKAADPVSALADSIMACYELEPDKLRMVVTMLKTAAKEIEAYLKDKAAA